VLLAFTETEILMFVHNPLLQYTVGVGATSWSAMATRLQSDPESDPMTGVELGSAEALSNNVR
jgi:hypothetical protein